MRKQNTNYVLEIKILDRKTARDREVFESSNPPSLNPKFEPKI